MEKCQNCGGTLQNFQYIQAIYAKLLMLFVMEHLSATFMLKFVQRNTGITCVNLKRNFNELDEGSLIHNDL